MSYSGYSQFICKNGHYWTVDCNLLMYDEDKQKCPICNEEEVFENMVDTTNGSFEDGERIDGYIKLELLEEHKSTCGYCQEEHRCKCSIYKIPKEKND